MSPEAALHRGLFVILWRYRVDTSRAEDFERTYGDAGPWAGLFRTSPEYRGSTLLRGAEPAGSYLLIDTWRDRSSYEDFLAAHRAEYDRLSAACAPLYLEEERLGAGSPILPG
jgi:hypothetical protein